MSQKMWIVRGDSGKLYDDFREKELVGLGWSGLAPLLKIGQSRKEILKLYRQVDPATKLGTARSGASQVWRFVNEIKVSDWVITRQIKWNTDEIDRDTLSTKTKNTLGSTLTVFKLPDFAVKELLGNKPLPDSEKNANISNIDDEEIVSDPLKDMEIQALERIKDKIITLDADEMELLVAGILRGMGYKTQVSPNSGSDRGKDIIASPDGFGFENPRIVVEVKHRKGQIASQDLRGFIGGRHHDDRGLYVSTGGFTKDARYEAERSKIPLSLWTLDDLVRTLIEYYEHVDIETKLLVPLRKVFLPALSD
ncbi:TPA: restriction endonuclease [Providencia rettgeri]